MAASAGQKPGLPKPASETEKPVLVKAGASHEQQAVTAAPSTAKTEPVSFLDVLIIFAGRKWLIARIIVACAVIGLVAALLLPNQFTATSTVKPPRENSSLSSMLQSQLGNLGGLISLAGGSGSLLKNPNDRYVAMFKSQTVEDATIRQFDLQKEYKTRLLSRTRKAFERHFKVEGSSKDGFLHVSVEDRNPERAAELANGWVDQFRKLSESLATGAASQREVFFKAQLQQAKGNLDNAENSLEAVQKKTGIVALSTQGEALLGSAARLQAEIVARQVQLQALETYATGQNAQVVELKNQIAGLQAQLAKLGGSGSAGAAGLVLPRGQLPQAGLEYLRRLREVKYQEALYTILSRQVELARLDAAKRGALIQVVDPAMVPDYHSSPHRVLIVILAIVVGLILGLAAALVWEYAARLRRDPQSAPKLALLLEQFGRRQKADPSRRPG